MIAVLDNVSDNNVAVKVLVTNIGLERAYAQWIRKIAEHKIYGAGKPAPDTAAAVQALGRKTLRAYTAMYAVRQLARRLPVEAIDVDQFWSQAVRRAVTAHALANLMNEVDPAEAFAVAFVQDVGTLVLAAIHGRHAGAIQEMMGSPVSTRLEEEQRLCSATHATVFKLVAPVWSFPEDLARVVAAHHERNADFSGTRLRKLAECCALADLIGDVFQTGCLPASVQIARERFNELETRSKVDFAVFLLNVKTRSSEAASVLEVSYKPPGDLSLDGPRSQPTANVPQGEAQLLGRIRQLEREKEELSRMLQRVSAEMKRNTTIDPVSTAVTRAALLDALSDKLGECADQRIPLAFLVLDIDHFRKINETFGHSSGDELLRLVVARISPVFRPSDVFGRLDGGKFGVVLPRTPGDGGVVAARRCKYLLGQEPLRLNSGLDVPTTCSFGGASWAPDMPGTSPDVLLHEAEASLQFAKQQGRNYVAWKR
jgi:diguanylate cyclase (GGDEF)-like protein